MPANSIEALYYITHRNNLPSIFERGVLSHSEIESSGILHDRVYDKGIIARRGEREVILGKPLLDYANFYFNSRNPMMYRVSYCQKKDVAVLKLRRDILRSPGAMISKGNAASSAAEILSVRESINNITSGDIWKRINAEDWRNSNETKRLTMSELLVPSRVESDLIDTIYVPDEEARKIVMKMRLSEQIHVIPEPHMFFRASRYDKIGDCVSLIEGDMFFSKMQTLTISVNTKGIMGRGLASKTKYQFPDVYVKYQDACKNKQLAIGKPFLHRRERSFDHELADMPGEMPHPNAIRWFLLFATKDDWRYPSRMEYIEKGMLWLEKNYKKEEITSIALPALGCGLGGLEWGTVGPLMCSVLSRLDINSEIYLPTKSEIDSPRENVIPEDQKTAAFLLEKSSGIR